MVPKYAIPGHVGEFIRLFLVSRAGRHCVDISTEARKGGQVTTVLSPARSPSGAVAGEPRENPAPGFSLGGFSRHDMGASGKVTQMPPDSHGIKKPRGWSRASC